MLNIADVHRIIKLQLDLDDGPQLLMTARTIQRDMHLEEWENKARLNLADLQRCARQNDDQQVVDRAIMQLKNLLKADMK